MRKSLAIILTFSLSCFCLTSSVKAAAGDLDPTYGQITTDFQGHGGVARAVVLQNNRKVVVGGAAFKGNIFSLSDFGLARYNPDGSLDSSFGSGGKVLTDFFNDQDEIHDLAIQPDGKIVAVGMARNGATFFFGLARYNTNGSLDSTFGTGGKVTTGVIGTDSQANAVILQPDGKIVVAGRGTTTTTPTNIDFALARFNPNGSIDTTFGTGGKVVTDMGGFDLAYDLALQPDGKLIAAGFKGDATSRDNYALARYNPDGSPDSTFGSGGKVATDFFQADDRGQAIALQRDGKMIVVGTVSQNVGGDPAYFGLARYNADGSPDNAFGNQGKTTTSFSQYGVTFAANNAIAIQPDGRILSVGWASGGLALARYDTAGLLDPSFGNGGLILTGGNGPLYAAALQPDAKLFVVGGNGAEGFLTARYLTAATNAPILQTEANSSEAMAIDSVTFIRGPFSVMNDLNFSSDHRTRIILFASNMTLGSGEGASSVTVEAQTSSSAIHQLPVEYAGEVPGCEWFTQVVVRLPDQIAGAGTVQVRITHAETSNAGSIVIQ